ncbi:MAG TPA: DsrH/TusB family sulfur metabolism protein [Methanomethylovorans sp.]|nr:DsrH/TusB family sulfur metabolism protein [Methanomethylovorans sp.]
MNEMNQNSQLHKARNPPMDIFLLTKPPNHDRARLCWKLIAQSKNPVLYLAGDGVYNLFCSAINDIPRENIFVCREDVEARGVQLEEKVMILGDFYEQMVEDIMDENNQTFTF